MAAARPGPLATGFFQRKRPLMADWIACSLLELLLLMLVFVQLRSRMVGALLKASSDFLRFQSSMASLIAVTVMMKMRGRKVRKGANPPRMGAIESPATKRK